MLLNGRGSRLVQDHLFLVNELVLEVGFDVDSLLINGFRNERWRQAGFLISGIRPDETRWGSAKYRSRSRVNTGSQARGTEARWQGHGFCHSVRSFHGYRRQRTTHRLDCYRLRVDDVVWMDVAMRRVVRSSSLCILALQEDRYVAE